MFRGWQPITFHDHDDNGRATQSWTEPIWSDEDRDLVIASTLLESRTGARGEYLPEATDPGADPTEYASGYRYLADGPFTNWAEKTAQDAMDLHRKQAGDKANLNGVFFTPRKLEYAPPEPRTP